MSEQRTLRILVVDDMPEIRKIIRHVLEKFVHAEIDEAEDGLEAISKAMHSTPQIVITDISMPRMTGLEFIGFMQQRSELSSIPVIVLTSHTDERTQAQALGLQVRAYLQKPFNPQKLLQTLSAILPDDSYLKKKE